jgi:hypothetical protein
MLVSNFLLAIYALYWEDSMIDMGKAPQIKCREAKGSLLFGLDYEIISGEFESG